MSKLLAISCSHKRQSPSTTDALLDSAVSGFQELCPSYDVARLRLIDYHLMLCVGEDECMRTGVCPLKDDFYRIVEMSRGATALLISMPVYGGNIPSVLKLFMERLKVFMNQTHRPFGNMPTGIIANSRTMFTEAALGTLTPWLLRLKNRNVVSLGVSRSAGPPLTDTEAVLLARYVGRQLASHARAGHMTEEKSAA